MSRISGVVLLLLSLGAGPLIAQASPTPTPGPTPAKAYTDSEFPPWVLELRRAEIIAVGSIPLTFLLSGIAYDYYYYFTNGRPNDNIPWPLGPGTSRWVSSTNGAALEQKNWSLIGIAVTSAIVVAAIDWWLGRP